MLCVNSCDSSETTPSTTTTCAVCSTVASNLQHRNARDKAVPSMTSTVSVMIGNTDHSAADSVVVAPREADGMPYAVFSSGRQQVSVAGDGSVVLTVSCSPMTADRPVPVCSTGLTRSDVHSSAAGQSRQNASIVTSQRFVVYVFLC